MAADLRELPTPADRQPEYARHLDAGRCAVTVVGDNYQVTVPATGTLFFRLQQQ